MNDGPRKPIPELAQGAVPEARGAEATVDARICGLLARGAAASGALASELGVPLRTVQYWLGRLALQGYVAQPKRGAWELTAAGRRAALTAQVPALAPLELTAVLAKLPPWHAAMVRLGVGAAIARRALAAEYPANWPTLIALGRTKTGKTLIGWVICRILGLDPTAQIRLLSFETAGSVGIRRTQRAGGDFEATLASLLRAPFVVFDELDKAPAEVRRAVGAVLLGQSVVEVEGTRLEVRATPMVTLNDDRERAQLLSEAHVRRAIVLNTRAPALREATRDLDQAAHELERAAIQALPEDLAPPAAQLAAAARGLLRAVLVASLTELGWERADVEPLARIALGYWALDPAGGPELAAARVALDYLLCTSTCEGELREDWDTRFAAAASARVGDGQLRDTLEAASKRQEVARAARGAALEGSRQAELALTARRAELRAIVDGAIRGAPRRVTDDERTVRAGAIAKGRVLKEWVGAAASLNDLAPVARQIEAEIVAPLRQLVTARERAAADVRREREAEAQQRRRQREERQRVDRYIGQLRRLYRRRRTRPGEDVLGQLVDLGCVVERSEAYVVEIEPSVLERAAVAVGVAAHALWHGNDVPEQAVLTLSDPYGLGLGGMFVGSHPVAAARRPVDTRPRRTERRVRTWYEDRADRTYAAAELRMWAAPAVRRALEAAAAAYGRGL